MQKKKKTRIIRFLFNYYYCYYLFIYFYLFNVYISQWVIGMATGPKKAED